MFMRLLLVILLLISPGHGNRDALRHATLGNPRQAFASLKLYQSIMTSGHTG